MDEIPEQDLREQVSREFANTYYSSLGSSPQHLMSLFNDDSVMDQIFVDQLHHRSEGRTAISYSLSETYRYGVQITIKKVFSQNSPLFPFVIVTVIGVFTYNGSSWPFVHVFYITSTFYQKQKFAVTNSILYDCINPSQIHHDQLLYNDIKLNHELRDEIGINKFINQNNIIDLCDKINISESNLVSTHSESSKAQNLSKQFTRNLTNLPMINGNGIYSETSSINYKETDYKIKSKSQTENEDRYEISPIDSQNRTESEVFSHIRRLSEDFDSPIESSTEYSYDNNALFIGSYPDSTTEEDITKVFSKYGIIQSIKMIHQKKIAFVTFKNSSSAASALRDGDIKLGDRTLRVQQRKIINSVKHVKRENLELYGYTKDDNTRRLTKTKKN